jgi:DNA-binding LacI/PurR family transcriptional regulator
MVTREDVAKAAGVSVSAVSRTMNGRGYVAKEKREAILKAVKDLGYRANPLSSSLKDGKTNQICFYTRDMYNPFYMDLFNIMSPYATEKGYSLFMLNTLDLSRVRSMLIDGMILGNESVAADVQQQMGENFYLPMVSASFGLSVIKTKCIPYVDVDAYDAVTLAVDYLQGLGHKKIAYATPYVTEAVKSPQARNFAFENLMRPVRGKELEKYMFVTPLPHGKHQNREYFFEEGIDGANRFLQSGCDATAILCFNDIYALGMMSQFRARGRKVPDDISIMGIDGIEARKYTSPLLTTIDMKISKQARTCVDSLLDLIEGRRVNHFISLKPCVLEGESVRKP